MKLNNNARQIAFEILNKIIKSNSFSNILLNEVSQNNNLSLKDKNFVFALVHGILVQKIYLEYVVNKFIEPKKTPREVKIILWMGIYQLKFMDSVPEYALVNEAVELCKNNQPRYSKLVNAVLQKIIRQKDVAFKVDVKKPEIAFCIENAFPYNLYKLIKRGYNLEIAQRIVIDSLKKPEISFRINTLKTTTNRFYEEYLEEYGLEKVSEVNDCLVATKPIVKSKAYLEGLITIQDKASILVSQILNPLSQSQVLDMCAAPGGKLTHLAALMQNHGAITAYELNTNRVVLVEENLKRLGVNNTKLLNDDANKVVNSKQKYDFILLDAPCSGFGVLKRKPEIKLNFENDNPNFEELYAIQKQLLQSAFEVLKDGGQMVYSTCTINNFENHNQISWFIKTHPQMEVVYEKQLYGDEINSDGFFICKIMKNREK